MVEINELIPFMSLGVSHKSSFEVPICILILTTLQIFFARAMYLARDLLQIFQPYFLGVVINIYVSNFTFHDTRCTF